jgi:hypothetical protein
MDMNLLVIKFKQTMDTYKCCTYSKSIWYVFRFNLDPFADMNFSTDTYRGYAYTKSIWSHFFSTCLKHIPKL